MNDERQRHLYDAIVADDVAAVREALRTGANPRTLHAGETALHTAVRSASVEMVEALIEGGAREWVRDREDRTPLEIARAGHRTDREALIRILDRNAIPNDAFGAAVRAMHAGDLARLETLLEHDPSLLEQRARGPRAYRKRDGDEYFRDPKLFWYVANNPTTVDVMPHNIVAVASAILRRGVAQPDRDYTLELVMTSAAAVAQGHQHHLMRLLQDAGARVTARAIVVTAAHGMLQALATLIEDGQPMNAPLAAALGDSIELQKHLTNANEATANVAFGLAVINRHVAAARVALDAGARIDAFLPVHAHGTALHQAAANDDVPMLALLLNRGANAEIEDTLWNATPHGWATFAGKGAAKAKLEELAPTNG